MAGMLKTIKRTFQTVMGPSQCQQSAVDIIQQWHSRPYRDLIFYDGRRESTQYLEAVNRLLQSPNSEGYNELMSMAMARLRGEFYGLLSRQADYTAGPASTTDWSSVTDSTAYAVRYEDYTISDPPSPLVIAYLRNIVEIMKLNGEIGKCVEIYRTVRKKVLQDQLKRLRFEELSVGYKTKRYHVWNELKVKMELWVQVSKICVKIFFQKEKQLCDQIFGDDDTRDECFVGTVQDFAIGLFGFAKDMSHQSYDKMEDVLGIYDAFLCVLPDANTLFDCELGKGIRDTCLETSFVIETEILRMLYDFEHAVLHEVSDVSDDKGVVHRSTSYTMEKVEFIVRNKNLLTNLIKTTPSLNFGNLNVDQDALGDFGNHSFLDLHLILILVVLQRNLESKSRSYKDTSLGYLFLMNNVHYIIQKIEESKELRQMIGDSYMRELNDNFEVARNGYETSTCNKLLSCFKEEGLYITRCFKSRPSRTAVVKRMKNFNAAFEEIRRVQSIWTIPDLKLREDVRASMSKRLVRGYEDFLRKFGIYPKIKLFMDKNVKYSIDDLKSLHSEVV